MATERRASNSPRDERRPSGSRRDERSQGSELLARILVAVPLAALALLLIHLGGIAWALFMIAVGWACMIELYGLLSRWRPVTVVGLAATAGLVLAARYGTTRDILEVATATIPVLFLAVIIRGQGNTTTAVASTLLGVYWIGVAVAHGRSFQWMSRYIVTWPRVPWMNMSHATMSQAGQTEATIARLRPRRTPISR